MSVGLLVRVGIDATAGGWNAPCSNDGRFCFVPMGASGEPTGLSTTYDAGYKPYRHAVAALVPESASPPISWPTRLPHVGHFDPDFEHLTYGDCGRRANRIRSVLTGADNGFIVFYAGLRSIETGSLCYSIIGFYSVDRIVSAVDVPPADWHRNQHTRSSGCSDPGTIIVFARPERSGRLLRHIPIGTLRSGMYRVTLDLLEEWGGLDVRDGYIQRSAHLPRFLDGERFLRWFDNQNVTFTQENNPTPGVAA